MAEAGRTIQRMGVPLSTDAGQRLFVHAVNAIMRSLPTVSPTDEQHALAVARHADHPDPAAIARAEAAVAAYERDLAQKAEVIRELMNLPQEPSP